jgi:hypothetical protein
MPLLKLETSAVLGDAQRTTLMKSLSRIYLNLGASTWGWNGSTFA